MSRIVLVEFDDEKKKIQYAFRTTLVKTVSYMQSSLLLSNPVLKRLAMLESIGYKDRWRQMRLQKLMYVFSQGHKTDEINDKVKAEWLIHMCDTDSTVEQWSANYLNEICDIFGYWNYVTHLAVITREKKYTSLEVESLLWTYPMGMLHQKEVSLKVSVEKRLTLACLGEQTICAERIVKESVKLFGSVAKVPVTKELTASSWRAQAEYVLQQEKEKNEQKLREKKQRKQELMSKEQMIISV